MISDRKRSVTVDPEPQPTGSHTKIGMSRVVRLRYSATGA
jgi:hypothetical protein